MQRNLQRIGIVAALDQEIRELKEAMERPAVESFGHLKVFTGRLFSKELTIILSGVGKKGAEGATDRLISSFDPKLLISAGYSGALSPELSIGDIVIAKRFLLESGGKKTFPPPVGFLPPPPGRWGDIYTSNRFIPTAREKLKLGRETGTISVDMESFYVGRRACEKEIPFLSIRSISDDTKNDLPHIPGLVDKKGNFKMRRAIPYFLSHPMMTVSGIGLLINSKRAAHSLNRYLIDIISSL